MAKRKRLTPAQDSFLAPDRAPEVKGFASDLPVGIAPRRNSPPIAQVAGEASATAALEEMTQMVTRARAEGRLILSLELSDIAADHLVRDRMVMDEEALENLAQSLRSRGQQTPIEVVDRGNGATPRYGLISGWRRITALGRLAGAGASAAGQEAGHVLALVRDPQSASDAYVAMVEENEIRVGLSNYERARIVAKAVEQGIYDDVRAGLLALFGNVPRAKRSKIKSFLSIVAALDDVLRFPAAISERLGLELSKALDDPALTATLRTRLMARPAEDAAAETALLSEALTPSAPEPFTPSPFDTPPEPAIPPDLPAPAQAQAKAQNRPAPSPRVPLAVTFQKGRVVLSGPEIDSSFQADLVAWLRARGFDMAD